MHLLVTLLIGSGLIAINMAIQVLGITLVVLYYQRLFEITSSRPWFQSARNLSLLMLFLLFSHLLQFATWALVFVFLGEFEDFATAFYHSTVNFTSLGYGDIVMSERWRLLGALEAANGVLMFGVTAGLVLSIMNFQFRALQDNASVSKGKGQG